MVGRGGKVKRKRLGTGPRDATRWWEHASAHLPCQGGRPGPETVKNRRAPAAEGPSVEEAAGRRVRMGAGIEPQRSPSR